LRVERALQDMRLIGEDTKRHLSAWLGRLRALRALAPLFAIVWNASRSLALLSLLLRFASAFCPVATLWVSKLIIDLVVGALRQRGVQSPKIWLLLGVECALAVGSVVLTRAVSLVDSLLGDLFTNEVNVRLMRHASKLDLLFFEDPEFYDKLERARRQAAARLGMLAGLAAMGQQLITLFSLLSAVTVLYPWLCPLLILAGVPVFLGETRFALLNYSMLYRNTPARRELDYLRYLAASSESAKEVRLYGLGDYLMARARLLFERFYTENKGLALQRATYGTLLTTLPLAAYYSAYALTIARTLASRLSVGGLTLAIGALARARNIIDNLVSGLAALSEQALFVDDLFEFLETQPRMSSCAAQLMPPRPILRGFEFQHVSFRYPGALDDAISGVCFAFYPGERVALVGENGAGKTTLIKLLTRLYDPTEGRILLDGVDLREYAIEELRREIGVIFQDYVRYDMSVSENIGFGNICRLDDSACIRSSARKSRAEPIIESLPNTYQQMLGRRFEGGIDLSVGQWQKIALARAYMRDAQVLILDEPTASLDARAEYEAYRQFAQLSADKMAMLISHRFSTVRIADRVLVLESGHLVEQGTHSELVSIHGKYAELFELQAAGYR
jgi:ATP-binding cassette subfamily B protein